MPALVTYLSRFCDRCPNSHNVQKAVRNVAEFEFEHTGLCIHGNMLGSVPSPAPEGSQI